MPVKLPAVIGVLHLILAMNIALAFREVPPLPWPEAARLMGAGLVAWLVMVALVHRLARSWPETHRRWLEVVLSLCALLLFGFWCGTCGLPQLLPGSTADLSPWLALYLSAWWLAWWPQQTAGTAWPRFASALRLSLAPMLALLLLLDLLEVALIASGLDLVKIPDPGPIASIAMTGGFGLLLLAAMPLLIDRVWGTQELPPGPQRALIEACCCRAGQSIRRIRLWPAHSPFYNAAVVGLLPATRSLLLSRNLLQELPPEELRAVLGHELGHIRHHHLWLYLAFLLAISMLAQVAGTGFAQISGMASPAAGEIAGLVTFALLLLFGLGSLSRACERQADLAGTELVHSLQAMQQALSRVANLNGQNPEAPSWMHGSIASRIRFLDRVRLDPGLTAQHHRTVMKLRFLVLLLLGLAFAYSLCTNGLSPVPLAPL